MSHVVQSSPPQQDQKRFRLAAAAAGFAAGVALLTLLIAPGVGAARGKGPVGADRGAFHADCAPAHAGPIDPIVQFGRPGMSHLHQFFGNRSTDARTTPSLLRKRESTTCVRDDELRGGVAPADSSAYWAPALYVGGTNVAPTELGAYYSAGPRRFKSIRPFPANLRMIAGDASGRTSPEINGQRAYLWRCGGETVEQPAGYGVPTCATPDLRLDISFPDCWDGRRVDSRDHKSHMAYSQKMGRAWECPPSHPVLVPRLKIQIRYPTRGGPRVKLSAGPARVAHADFMNGWDRGELRKLVRRCLNADRYCGGTDRPVPGHA